MAAGDELKFLKLTFDYADVEQLQKIIGKIGTAGAAAMKDWGAQTEKVSKKVKRMTEDLEKAKKATEGEHKESIASVDLVKKREAALKRQLKLEERIAKLYGKSLTPNIAAAGIRAADAARKATAYVKRRRFGGMAADTGRAVGKAFTADIGKSLKGLGKIVGKFLKNPMMKFFNQLLDFEGMFKFNQNVLAASGGVSMLGKEFNELTRVTTRSGKSLESLGTTLHDSGIGFRFMMDAGERLEGLQGIATSGRSAATILGDGFENLGDVMTDITLQSRVFSRVMGKSIGEVSTMMGEMIYGTGLGISQMGDSFARLLAQSMKLNIGQGMFMDLIRGSTQNMGAYQRVLEAAGDTLALMATAPTATPRQVQEGFEALSGVFTNQNAQVMLTSAARGGGPFRAAIEEMLGAEMSRGGSFAKEVRQGMTRAEMNKRVAGVKDPEQAHHMQETFENMRLLEGLMTGSADFFQIQASAAEGGIGADVAALFMNQLARKFGGRGEDLRDVELERTLAAISQITGIDMRRMRALQRTLGTDEELRENIRQRGEPESPMDRMERLFHELKEATEAPMKGFNVIMQELVRTIQELLMDLVRELMPIAIDILTNMLTGIGQLIKSMAMMASWFDVGEEALAEVFNFGVALAGGQQLRNAGALQAAGYDPFDIYAGLMKGDAGSERVQQEFIEKGYGDILGGREEGIAQRVRGGAQTAYGGGIVGAQEQLYKGGESVFGRAMSKRRGIDKSIEELTAALENQTGGQKDATKKQIAQAQQFSDNLTKLLLKLDADRWVLLEAYRTATAEGNILGVTAVADLAERARETVRIAENTLNRAVGGRVDVETSRTTSRSGAAGVERRLLGYQDGAHLTDRTIGILAENQPETALPLDRVPDIFARTIEAAGGLGVGGGGINVGQMVFQVHGTALKDPESFARRVRTILRGEFEGMLRDLRTT